MNLKKDEMAIEEEVSGGGEVVTNKEGDVELKWKLQPKDLT